jgi:hypothetical protein
MRQLSSKLTYANVISTLCLFLLLGGGAYAALKLPKNSVGTKQLKKNAVTGVKVKNHSLTAQDFRAGQLPAGKEGSAGPKGEPGPLVETLPSGKTEHGFYAIASTRASGSSFEPGTSISYPIPLAFSPTIHIVATGGSASAECPGSEAEPRATAGNLCIYEGRATGGSLEAVKEKTEGKLGILLFFEVAPGANYEFYGSWAVTAP